MNNKETCPWCNKSMEPGTLYSRGGTFFLPDGESFPKLYTKSSMDKKRAVILGQHSPVFGQIAPAQAHICRHCKRIILCLLCILCLLTACGSRSSEPELFFAWTQGYLASPVDEENTIALTLYEKKELPAFDFSEIQSIHLEGVPDEDVSLQYELAPIDADSSEAYQPYALTLTYTPRRTGIYQAESVVFTLNDQTQLTYPLGRLVFEIGEADSQTIDTWCAPVASSNSEQFPYQYSLYHANSKLVELKIGETTVLAAAEGLPTEGKVSLADAYSAPLVIIRSKLSIDQNGEIVISYGKGCYCGAINVGDSIFERSFKHWAS